MGFSTLIDILGSTLIGGMLLMILLRLNDASVDNNFKYSGELTVQENLVAVVQLLEHDFRKIGYCAIWKNIVDPSKAIIQATDTSITFLSDVGIVGNLEGDGVVDTVRYFIGKASELASTPNPNDKLLYRVVNNAPLRGSNVGVTEFNMVFFDALGDTVITPITTPGEIYTMQINVKVENTAAYGQNYDVVRSAFWRQIRLAARNIRNR
jgi:hypothetical protein